MNWALAYRTERIFRILNWTEVCSVEPFVVNHEVYYLNRTSVQVKRKFLGGIAEYAEGPWEQQNLILYPGNNVWCDKITAWRGMLSGVVSHKCAPSHPLDVRALFRTYHTRWTGGVQSLVVVINSMLWCDTSCLCEENGWYNYSETISLLLLTSLAAGSGTNHGWLPMPGRLLQIIQNTPGIICKQGWWSITPYPANSNVSISFLLEASASADWDNCFNPSCTTTNIMPHYCKFSVEHHQCISITLLSGMNVDVLALIQDLRSSLIMLSPFSWCTWAACWWSPPLKLSKAFQVLDHHQLERISQV